MSSSELAISVRGVSKAYTIRHEKSAPTTMAEAIATWARHPFRSGEREQFWALKDVDFDVNRGEVVGLIGRNGAGKSTLLKILSQITEMTEGQVDLYGRVGSLLEVGTGFHQELTGRENIFLNGAILGMTRAEIRRQFDAIVDFAGVERFLDTPVKRYSNGMYVRLAFAVAAHLRSEILIVDEVLAVGDREFQRKCLGKMSDVASDGRTVLLVTHNMAAITNLCSKGILLRDGRVAADGSAEEAVARYTDSEDRILVEDLSRRLDRRGSGEIRCVRLSLTDPRGGLLPTVRPHEAFHVVIEYEAAHELAEVEVSIDVEALDGTRIATLYSGFRGESFEVSPGHGTFACEVAGLPLRPDVYSLNVLIMSHHAICDFVQRAAPLEILHADFLGPGRLPERAHGPLIADYRWTATEPVIGTHR
jgi:lipopolysaccharide transport system ATP-binding protein